MTECILMKEKKCALLLGNLLRLPLSPHLTCNIHCRRAGACWPVTLFWLSGCLPSVPPATLQAASQKGGFEARLKEHRCGICNAGLLEVLEQHSSGGWGPVSFQWYPFYFFQCRIQMAITWFWPRPRSALLQEEEIDAGLVLWGHIHQKPW